MLTIYDPDVSNRLSILHCEKWGRPLSATSLRASPWDQITKYKPEGKYHAPHKTSTLELSHIADPSVKIIPQRFCGIRTSYSKRQPKIYSAPSHEWNGGLKVLKWKNRESGPEKYRGNKAVISAQNKSSYQVQSTVFPTARDLVPAPQKPDSLRTLRLARRNMSSFSLSPEHGKRDFRQKGENISLAAKTINCFERKTTLKRYYKGSSELSRVPYGTERSMDFIPPQRRFHHFDTRALLAHST